MKIPLTWKSIWVWKDCLSADSARFSWLNLWALCLDGRLHWMSKLLICTHAHIYMCICKADLWATWVWTAKVHLYIDFFFHNKYYNTTISSSVGWISRCRTIDMEVMRIQYGVQFSTVQSLSHVRFFVTPWAAARQASLSMTNSGVHPNPCPLSRWCHPTISSSVAPLSSCPQSFPASGSFQMSQLFTSGGQSVGVSASTSVPPMNTQDWSPLGWTGWISLQPKGLSRVFSNTTVQKHQFFSAQLSL